MKKRSFGNLMAELLQQHSFCLQKMSPLTFANDITTTHKRHGSATLKECKAIIALQKRGTCWRCRLGKGRFHYGESAHEAITFALGAKKKL